jgi:zinc/manganese transport system permease protein
MPDLLTHPEFRRALVAVLALSVGGTPLGIFLVQRRMALVGDVLSHGILPGVAVAFLVAGAAPGPMTLGGLIAGLLVALSAGLVARLTPLKEDTSFMGSYLISLALGVLLISLKGGSEELVHILFGDALHIDPASLKLTVTICAGSFVVLMAFYRLLAVECFDPDFLRVQGGSGALAHMLFLTLMVLNLVVAFQSLGTLMALGIIALPAIAARFWTQSLDRMLWLSIALAALCGTLGLVIAWKTHTPPGSVIVLTAGAAYLFSVLIGPHGGMLRRFFPAPHLEG